MKIRFTIGKFGYKTGISLLFLLMYGLNGLHGQSKCYSLLQNNETRKQKWEQELYRKQKIRKITFYTLTLDSADTNFFKTKIQAFDKKGRLIEENDFRFVRIYQYSDDDLVISERVYDLEGHLYSQMETEYLKRKPVKRSITSEGVSGTIFYFYNNAGQKTEERYSGALYSPPANRVIRYNNKGAIHAEYQIIDNPPPGTRDTVDVQIYSYQPASNGWSDTVRIYDKDRKLFQTLIYVYDKQCRCVEEYRQSSLLSIHYTYDTQGFIRTVEMKDNFKAGSVTFRSEHIRDFSGKLVKEYYPTRPNNDIGVELEYEYYTE
jgi:hypothetical protein